MAVTNINSATFLSDTIILIRNKIKDNIADPLSGARPASERFVYTSYPKNAVTYPVITITDRGIIQPQKLGMASEGTLIDMTVDNVMHHASHIGDDAEDFLKEQNNDNA